MSVDEVQDGQTPVRPLHASQVHGEVADGWAEETPGVASVLPESEEGLAESPGPVRSGRSRGWWAGWIVGMASVGAVVGLGVVGYLKFVDGPVDGVTSAKTLAAARASNSPTPTPPHLLSGLAVELAYPGSFDTVGRVQTDAQAVEQYNIGSKADYRRMIAVNVRPLPSGKLEDDSSYRFRQLDTVNYQAVTDKIRGEAVVVMIKKDRQEQTLFWAHAGREVTVAVTSSNPRDDVGAFLREVMASLRWRQ